MGGAQSNSYTRFRSFAERYLIERASTFTKGNQEREAHEELLNATTIFGMIEAMDKARQSKEINENATQGNTTQAQPLTSPMPSDWRMWKLTDKI